MRRNAIIDAVEGRARIVFLALSASSSGAAWASPPLHTSGEADWVEATVAVSDPNELASLRAILTLDHGHRPPEGGALAVRVVARPGVLAALEAQGRRVTEIVPHRRGPPPAGYRSPDAGHALLRELAATHERAGHIVLGRSREGRTIEGLWLGQPPASGAPTYRVLGAHHGDEWSSFEVALEVAEALADLDGVDPLITAWLDDATVWVVPYVNPDGVLAGMRYNAAFVDLNRNYSYEWDPDEYGAGPAPFSEPETRAIRDQFLYDPPLLGLSMHAGATNLGYVWNFTTDAAPDRAILADLARVYADVTTQPDFWVTQGADWYITHGDTNDWSYGAVGALDYTVELTLEKAPSVDEIPLFVEDHLEASLAFLGVSPDLSGAVVDAATGAPVHARVRVLDGAGVPVGGWFTTDPEAGRFHRITQGAGAILEVEAPGWISVQLPFDPLDRQAVVALAPGPRGAFGVSPRVARVGQVVGSEVDGPVTFDRPGEIGATTLAVGGSLTVPPLAPGAWTVLLPDGAAVPNGLLVAEAPPSSQVTGDQLAWTGGPFEPGTRAWAIAGPGRALSGLPILFEDTDELRLDLSGVPDEVVDVMVLSGGVHAAVADVRNPAAVGDVELVKAPGCGCASAPGASSSWFALAAGWAMRRARGRGRGTGGLQHQPRGLRVQESSPRRP